MLILEDGIPIALAPYGEPEMYYTPSIDRMKSIELLKGCGSIIYGPQTIGGVMNYITNDPPPNEEIKFRLIGGNGGYLNTKLSYGNGNANNGMIAELYHKRADKIGLTNFSAIDFLTKTKITVDEHSVVKIKTSVYDETSNSTYLGITQNMFENGEYYPEMVPNDLLSIRRYSLSAVYQRIINKSSIVNFTVFGNHTVRDWKRQDFGRSASVSNKTGLVFGDTSIENGAIYLRNSNANRNRTFDVIGSQIDYHTNLQFFGFENSITSGLRFIHEKAYEQRINGTKFTAISGNLVENEIRTGNALSFFTQDKIDLSDDVLMTIGLRYELFKYDRDISRMGSKDTSIFASNDIAEIIPGFGINYNLNDNITFFAGIHRGFAPPRTKDAITTEGMALDLSAELSWNYEIGIRPSFSEFLTGEFTFYTLDFSNQIIPVSVSSGGAGFGLINGGSTFHQGLELALMLDISKLLNMKNQFNCSFSGNYGSSYYSNDRFIAEGSESVNIKNNNLPYAPNLNISSIIQYKMKSGFGVAFNAVYVGEQFTDELNTKAPSADGLTGIIDPYYLLDLTVSYSITDDWELFASVKNLTDERYIASRRPQGIKVSVPRIITAGIDIKL
jgi:Fe(3+) dicitrate transport protein